MPYPTPHNSQVELLTGIPLDNSYRNSIWFANEGAQATYFLNHRKAPLEHFDCMYHRESEELRVNAPIQDCLDVNYVMWRNHAYSTKWFYAFVTECRYINANCTGLKIELDVLQTWYFDYQLLPCFIERCHTATDNIGDYILPEPVETGEPIVLAETPTAMTVFKYWDIIAFSTFDWSTWAINPSGTGSLNNGNVFSALNRTRIGQIELTPGANGAVYSSYSMHPGYSLSTLLDQHPDLVDGVVAIVMTPTAFEIDDAVHVGIPKPTATSALAGYTPRNRKLYTKQFTRLLATDGSGAGKYFAFEDFVDPSQCDFWMYSDRAPSQSVICAPDGYNGLPAGHRNYQDALIMTGFPQCAWVSDTFKTYLAQNQATLGLSLATAGAQVIGGTAMTLATGGIGTLAGAGMATSGITSIVNTLAALEDRTHVPPKLHGNVTNTALMAVGEKAFKFIIHSAKPEYLAVIDDFFDLYGYTVDRVGVPNIHARPHWTYVKTSGAAAVPATGAGCTATALRRIQSIFDAGITFWADGYEVGDYSLDNRV